MTQNMEKRIIRSWTLFAFAKQFGGKLSVGTCTNQGTGDTYPACTFDNGEKRTFVGFGESLKDGLSTAEIVKRKDSLQVVQLQPDAETIARRREKGTQEETYKLCVVGENSWDTVDLLA